jgi:hypothetical protein
MNDRFVTRRGQQHNRRGEVLERIAGADRLEDAQPVHVRHEDIEQSDIDLAVPQHLDRLLAIVAFDDIRAHACEYVGEHTPLNPSSSATSTCLAMSAASRSRSIAPRRLGLS